MIEIDLALIVKVLSHLLVMMTWTLYSLFLLVAPTTQCQRELVHIQITELQPSLRNHQEFCPQVLLQRDHPLILPFAKWYFYCLGHLVNVLDC